MNMNIIYYFTYSYTKVDSDHPLITINTTDPNFRFDIKKSLKFNLGLLNNKDTIKLFKVYRPSV